MQFYVEQGLLKWAPSSNTGTNQFHTLPSLNGAKIWIMAAFLYMELCLRHKDNMRVVAKKIRGYLDSEVCFCFISVSNYSSHFISMKKGTLSPR